LATGLRRVSPETISSAEARVRGLDGIDQENERAMGYGGRRRSMVRGRKRSTPNVQRQRSEDSGPNSETNLMDGDGDAAFYFLRETDDVPIR